jgi:hypothetical protein
MQHAVLDQTVHGSATTLTGSDQCWPSVQQLLLLPILEPVCRTCCLAIQVVAEFSRLSARLSLLPVGAAGAAAALAAHRASAPGVRPLEMFFPFDPYLLHRSARLLDLEVGSQSPVDLKPDASGMLLQWPVHGTVMLWELTRFFLRYL